jgi:hypothetical protein
MLTTPLNFTLLTDGSSDRVLLPILRWLLIEHLPSTPINGQWADLSAVRTKPADLSQRILSALRLYPCDLLFVHRDAEAQPADLRYDEIMQAYSRAALKADKPPYICVVPIRMQEAWLLLDEQAIRSSAGNPKGRVALDLPAPAKIENLSDPKAHLHSQLIAASELTGRRRAQFDPGRRAHLIPEYMRDFAVLRQLSAFNRLERDIRHWASGLHR